jgi:hypothetical protein
MQQPIALFEVAPGRSGYRSDDAYAKRPVNRRQAACGRRVTAGLPEAIADQTPFANGGTGDGQDEH